MQRLLLTCNLCPGDVLTLTAAVESLHQEYPGEYETAVQTTCMEIWEHNPRISRPEKPEDNGYRKLEMHYGSIGRCNQESIPFLSGYTEDLAAHIDRPLRCRVNRPQLYLAEKEKEWIDQVRQHVTHGRKIPFWLVNAGIKSDYTAKLWPVEHYQEVIDRTRGRIQWVQIGAQEHWHPELRGVIDLRGKTTHRELIRLAWHCQGGLGPVTYLQHLCAAWEKPYVCLLGGREPVTWVQYPLQTTLHTMGMLDCCRQKACWRSRVEPLSDRSNKDGSLCHWPVMGLQRAVGRCMAMIQPDEVLNVLERL